MTNEQIILNEAAKLDPATLHAIAAAHHTPEQIAAIAAKATTTDDDGNEKPASVADVEAVLAADELHTIAKWNSLSKRIRTGEKSLITCYLWKYTTKPSKEQREAAEAEGKEAAPAPHFYPTKSYLFSCLQVEDAKAAPAACMGTSPRNRIADFVHEIRFFVIELNFFVIKTSTHLRKPHEMEHFHG